ncbi:MAG: hypothetical protein V1824_00545, partial [archaeon]
MKTIKKAVSPIIATVLIVLVSVVLTGILLSWGVNYIQQKQNLADNTIDTSCIGADITISTCDYNTTGESLSFVLINSGKVNFNEENKFNLILIDADNTLDNSNTDI